ncbi:MAG: dynamin family protein [Gemmatales bacterium]|nr:dynamin family protein [Gemmatales bacterium]
MRKHSEKSASVEFAGQRRTIIEWIRIIAHCISNYLTATFRQIYDVASQNVKLLEAAQVFFEMMDIFGIVNHPLIKTEYDELMKKFLSWLQWRPLRLVFMGRFNHGKSTLINALLGRNILPAGLIPTTSSAIEVQLSKDGQEGFQVRQDNSDWSEHLPLEMLDDYINPSGTVQPNSPVRFIRLSLSNCALLRYGLTVVDTPGIGDNPQTEQLTYRQVEHADLVIFILHARWLLSLEERELIGKLKQNWQKPVILVVNFMDLIHDPRDLDDIQRRIEGFCATQNLKTRSGKLWFAVSAKQALQGQPGTDFLVLRDHLINCGGHPGYSYTLRLERLALVQQLKSLRQKLTAELPRANGPFPWHKEVDNTLERLIALENGLPHIIF